MLGAYKKCTHIGHYKVNVILRNYTPQGKYRSTIPYKTIKKLIFSDAFHLFCIYLFIYFFHRMAFQQLHSRTVEQTLYLSLRISDDDE